MPEQNTKSEFQSWGPQICSIIFRWDVSVRHSLVIFSKAEVQLCIFRIAIRHIGKWSWLFQGIVYDLFLLTLQHQNHGPLSTQKPWGGPRIWIAHLNEEKKMFGNKTRQSLEYPPLLLSLSWAVCFNALHFDINFFLFLLPFFLCIKLVVNMMQVAGLDVQSGSRDSLSCLCFSCHAVSISQVVAVPPQVTFRPVWILLLPEPVPVACSYDMLLPEPLSAFWPDCRNLLLSDGEFLPSYLA